jgi:hypothetical protein
MRDTIKKKSYRLTRKDLLELKEFLNTEEFKEEALKKLGISEKHLSVILKSISGSIESFAYSKPLIDDPINDYLKKILEQGNDEEFWSVLQSRKVSKEETREIKDNMLKLISVLKDMKQE